MQKTVTLFLIIIFICSLYWSIKPEESECYHPDQEYIRFHVLANSDEPNDQKLKYQIKDILVQEISKKFIAAKSLAETRRILADNLFEIGRIGRKALADLGSDYSLDVQYGYYSFPTKYYNSGFSLPAGNYEAVRVVIGEGSGANWWCVLFPPMCFVHTDQAQLEQEISSSSATAEKPIIRLRFKIIDWLIDLLVTFKKIFS